MKTVHVDPKRPGMLVRDDDPTAGYLVGVEAVEVARAINSYDILRKALEAIRAKAQAGERGLAHQVFKIADAALAAKIRIKQ